MTIQVCLCTSICSKVYFSPENVDSQLECNTMHSKICLNGGVCADWSKLLNVYPGSYENCICMNGFYGPHCEYMDELYFARKSSEMGSRISPRMSTRMRTSRVKRTEVETEVEIDFM